MFSGCQSHQNIDILVPKNTNKAAKQQSWCQDGVGDGAKPAAKQPSWCQDATTSAKLVPRYQDFLRARGVSLPLVGFPWSAGDSKNRPFWYPATNMTRYHDNLLFTTQKLCFHVAKDTTISTFWYPESPIKQLNS